MRTDVKVGLIGAFVVLGGLLAYFAWQGQRKTTAPDVIPHQEQGVSARGTTDGGPGATTLPDLSGGGLGGGSDRTAIIAPPGAAGGAASMPAGPSGLVSVGGSPTAASAPGATMPAAIGGAAQLLPPGGRGAFDTSSSTQPYGGLTPTSPGGLALGGGYSTPPRSLGATGPVPGSGLDYTSPPPRSGLDSGTTPPPSLDTASPLGAAGASSASIYVVKKDDNFTKIAKGNKITLQALENANRGVDSSRLRVGQKLNLPAPGPALGSSTPSMPPLGGAASATPTTTTRPAAQVYVVKAGDTLTKIAKANGTTVQAMVKANPRIDPDNIEVGQKLKLPAQ